MKAPQKFTIVHLEDHPIYQRGVQQYLDTEKKYFCFQSFQHPTDALHYIKDSLKRSHK